jgi:hypothetical protein
VEEARGMSTISNPRFAEVNPGSRQEMPLVLTETFISGLRSAHNKGFL